MLMANLLPTAIEAVSGFILGNLAAITLATAFVYRKTMEEALFPIAVMVNTIPVVAKAPILVLLLGNGMEPKIAIAAIICFFPTLVNMTRGLRDVRAEQLELMRILSATPREVFLRIRVPERAALPVLRPEDRRFDRRDRRHRRRMDRIDQGHRRADHPVDLQFRFAACSTPPSSSARLSRHCSSASSRSPRSACCAGT